MKDGPFELKGFFSAIEVRVLQTHVQDKLRLAGHMNRVDPDKWKPMIMSFQKLYGLKDGKLSKVDFGRHRGRNISPSSLNKYHQKCILCIEMCNSWVCHCFSLLDKLVG